MTMLTITSKGQVTLRKDVLEHLGVGPGDKVVVEKLPSGRIGVSAPRRTGKISDLSGVLKRPGQPTLTIEEMNEVIADSWAGKR
jgi:AbrB family looped-hinge helix DNA binding protein